MLQTSRGPFRRELCRLFGHNKQSGSSSRPREDAAPLTPQHRLQSIFFLGPAGIFGLRPLLQPLRRGLDRRGSLGMLPLSLVQCRLHLVDGLLPTFTLLLRGGSSSSDHRSAVLNATTRRAAVLTGE